MALLALPTQTDGSQLRLAANNTMGDIKGAEVMQTENMNSAVSAVMLICKNLLHAKINDPVADKLREESLLLFGAIRSIYAPTNFGFNSEPSVHRGEAAAKLALDDDCHIKAVERLPINGDVEFCRRSIQEAGECCEAITRGCERLIEKHSKVLSQWTVEQKRKELALPDSGYAPEAFEQVFAHLSVLERADKITPEIASGTLQYLLNMENPKNPNKVFAAQLACLNAYQPSSEFRSHLKEGFTKLHADNHDLLQDVKAIWDKLGASSRVDFLRYWIEISRIEIESEMGSLLVSSGECNKNAPAHFAPSFNKSMPGVITFSDQLLTRLSFDQAIIFASHEFVHAWTYHLLGNDPKRFREDMTWAVMSDVAQEYIYTNFRGSKRTENLEKLYSASPHECTAYSVQGYIGQILVEVGVVSELVPTEVLEEPRSWRERLRELGAKM